MARDLSSSEKLRVRQDLATLLHLNPQLGEIETQLARLSTVVPWADPMTYLIQLPGIGMLTALTIPGAIGDITRFASPKKLGGYAGLGARVYASGQTHRGGRITTQGRRHLRAVLVEAAKGIETLRGQDLVGSGQAKTLRPKRAVDGGQICQPLVM